MSQGLPSRLQLLPLPALALHGSHSSSLDQRRRRARGRTFLLIRGERDASARLRFSRESIEQSGINSIAPHQNLLTSVGIPLPSKMPAKRDERSVRICYLYAVSMSFRGGGLTNLELNK